jgi:hypothetical protein
MTIKTAILWLHATCGIAWVIISVGFFLATAALSSESQEMIDFAARAAPRLTRVCIGLAVIIPLTGFSNLFFAARGRRFVLPPEFIEIVIAKIALYSAMGAALWAASGVGSRLMLSETGTNATDEKTRASRRLMTLYVSIALMGTVALGLGVWLSGT